MGGWKLEVFRMALYVTFPVVMFHIFNNPQYFEEAVVKTKREMYPPDDESRLKTLEDLKIVFRRKQEQEIEQEFARLT